MNVDESTHLEDQTNATTASSAGENRSCKEEDDDALKPPPILKQSEDADAAAADEEEGGQREEMEKKGYNDAPEDSEKQASSLSSNNEYAEQPGQAVQVLHARETLKDEDQQDQQQNCRPSSSKQLHRKLQQEQEQREQRDQQNLPNFKDQCIARTLEGQEQQNRPGQGQQDQQKKRRPSSSKQLYRKLQQEQEQREQQNLPSFKDQCNATASQDQEQEQQDQQKKRRPSSAKQLYRNLQQRQEQQNQQNLPSFKDQCNATAWEDQEQEQQHRPQLLEDEGATMGNRCEPRRPYQVDLASELTFDSNPSSSSSLGVDISNNNSDDVNDGSSSSDPETEGSCIHAVLVEDRATTVWADATPMAEHDEAVTRRRRWFLAVVSCAFVALAVGLAVPLSLQASATASPSSDTAAVDASQYNCSLPGLETLTPGQYSGVQANYLSFAFNRSTPNFVVRAKEFEACTGGTIVFSEASDILEDPLRDLGTISSRGTELFDGYLMSYTHFPEVSQLGLAEHLNERIRSDNARLKWEDVLPQVKKMGEYRKDGVTNLDFLMYDGDFFVPIIRLDLLEKHDLPLPNTFEETVELAEYFHGMDLNDDGEPDYGFCHFPRAGEGYFDPWWSELVYSTWATTDQTQGSQEGFIFDPYTMEPNIGAGFSRAAQIWKDLWTHGSGTTEFITGRCAIGFGPPGEWKSVFLNGVSRKDANGTEVWKPTMKNGEYAEPYRFRPFGSLEVVDRWTGDLTPCTEELCPKAEVVPSHGHHGANDRASVLKASPIAGQLINRAPFYWSGGLGTLIRKSAPEIKKDLLWDFFVYTNSPDTSVSDVASYGSWLDSWRYSQLEEPGDNFLKAGWSRQAFQEHKATHEWALSDDVNGALNLRIPGVSMYTRDVKGGLWSRFIAGDITLGGFVAGVEEGWNKVTEQHGKLDQLEIYRSSLGLDSLSGPELCRLHFDLVKERDPSACVYEINDSAEDSRMLVVVVVSILVPFLVVILLVQFYYNKRRTRLIRSLEVSDKGDTSAETSDSEMNM